ncbi:hypothetical protein L6452_20112 [Arctium lappa]|uniref:Uncharacterized protein n=1 Tax=Arctium lappa TaxID=4217 RepID=A0ACB9BAZ8_ARCLA|nr:hypothetical protein L6452_20112 [Arctium lappa]
MDMDMDMEEQNKRKQPEATISIHITIVPPPTPTHGLECNYKNEQEEEELFRQRALSFIASMRHVQGNRGFMGWKGSVVDSVVGVFLTQNAPDSLSSSAFMCLAAKYLIGDPTKGINKHALDWNAVRCAQPYEISHVIQERGMNNRIAARIQTFLGSIYNHKSGILDDLEWEFFSKIYGLGIKSMDCLRLLTLRQHAFPVDRHVARIVVRLGWVPIEKLPDGVLIHELKEYPTMEAVQDYLSHRLSNLDVDTFTSRFPPQVENTFVPRTPTPGQASHFKVRLEEDIEDLYKVPPVIKGKKVMKNATGRLRTEHQVYELPDSHPLVQKLEKREGDDKNPYLLAIWPRAAGKEKEVVVGRFLVPCRTATRGAFPLDGTFFQINEVFADDESCKKPVVVPRNLLLDLTVKTLFCGTSISAIFRGLSSDEIRDCFWKGTRVMDLMFLACFAANDRAIVQPMECATKWNKIKLNS